LSSGAAAFASFSIRTKAALAKPEHGESEAKFWLRPAVSLAYNDGFNAKTLRELLNLVEANRELIEKTWNDFFG